MSKMTAEVTRSRQWVINAIALAARREGLVVDGVAMARFCDVTLIVQVEPVPPPLPKRGRRRA